MSADNINNDNIIKVNIDDEMRAAYIDYSMSVIVSRAIPDARDGFKPVHRRVLFGMYELGVNYNKPYKKSARVVGEVLGKYHPHGDTAVYDSMVRMAQPWSLRYPLLDGQGNFGSVDGDDPAAMRYTEIRFKKIAEEMLADLDKDTVDFSLNFDDTLEEPTVLPTKIPNLLINGASGIAVGMATNIMPHNLSEVIDATIAYIDNKNITISELCTFVKAPDFPTGGTIYGMEGIKAGFETGRGRVVLRAKTEIETENGKEKIIVTEIPYQVNKSVLVKKIAELVNDKKIEGITDLRDESDRTGMRIVIELRRDVIASVILNKLYQQTPLQSSYGINNIALVNGRPRLLNLKDMLIAFVDFRHEVITRRTNFELDKAQKRAHILEGLLKATESKDILDAIIDVIRNADTSESAKERLIERWAFSEEQAKAILELRLRQLVGLEREKLKGEYDELIERINYFKNVLSDESLRMQIIKNEIIEIKKEYGDSRKTDIVYASDEINMEDLIADDDVAITISHLGYIKRTPLIDYKSQNRGGKGSKGGATRDEDFIEHLLIATNHNYLLFFTNKGRCHWLRVFDLPEGNKTTKGRALQNIMQLESGEKIKAFINIKDLTDKTFIENNFIIFCTKWGTIKKTTVEAYSRPRTNGIIALTIEEGDELLSAQLTNGSMEIVMATKEGKAIRFNESKIRPTGRSAMGVKGCDIDYDTNEVVGMITVDPSNNDVSILVVSEKGYGKRTDLEDYRITNRGAKGVKTINITDKTGNLITVQSVNDADDLMIINESGLTIRITCDKLRVMGRNTQGVKLINIKDNDTIASIAKIENADRSEEEIDAETEE
jgi:DNA gyrase subunit A